MEKEQVISEIDKMNDTRFEIFCQMLEMKTQKEIAESLGMNIKAVKYHIGAIYKSFNISICKSETQSKRLVFCRSLMDFKPKYELGISDLAN